MMFSNFLYSSCVDPIRAFVYLLFFMSLFQLRIFPENTSSVTNTIDPWLSPSGILTFHLKVIAPYRHFKVGRFWQNQTSVGALFFNSRLWVEPAISFSSCRIVSLAKILPIFCCKENLSDKITSDDSVNNPQEIGALSQWFRIWRASVRQFLVSLIYTRTLLSESAHILSSQQEERSVSFIGHRASFWHLWAS